MQDIIKRYFWVVAVITVIVCAVFAAKATGSILTAKFLGDSPTAPKVTPIARPDLPVKATHSKDGAQLGTEIDRTLVDFVVDQLDAGGIPREDEAAAAPPNYASSGSELVFAGMGDDA